MSRERRGEWQDWPFEPLAVLRALNGHGVEYVLIGGVAAVLQGSPLPTYDIDITPAPGARNRARLLAALADLDGTALTDPDGEQSDVSFYTPFGHVDVHHRPAGFTSYTELRRGSRPIQLEPNLMVHASSLRDIIRSRLALGDDRQLPALEAALELDGSTRPT
ncbi:MAG: hypothetical protein MSC30_04905 [Gaiellaceae bacterium MAG52_C11]|nr:hypothetical protein [Candidatus Gaiellasilicea maunaloa]